MDNNSEFEKLFAKAGLNASEDETAAQLLSLVEAAHQAAVTAAEVKLLKNLRASTRREFASLGSSEPGHTLSAMYEHNIETELMARSTRASK